MPDNTPAVRELKAIVDWVNLHDDVREISLKVGDVELFMSRDGGASRAVAPAVAPVAVAAPVAASAPTPAPAPAAAVPAAAPEIAADEHVITAPMVGTFYSAPKPGDPPFVSVGAEVTTTTVLGIVEVMKLMTNLEARVDGTVARILVDNEQAVEYGQPLMVIRRRG